jgi:hypothetical protein
MIVEALPVTIRRVQIKLNSGPEDVTELVRTGTGPSYGAAELRAVLTDIWRWPSVSSSTCPLTYLNIWT